MKYAAALLFVLPCACSSSNDSTSVDGGVDASPSATVVDAGPPGACHASVLNAAPPECQSDWSHAKLQYPSRCSLQNDGFQAACDPYDAIVYQKSNSTTFCLYDKKTGNLTASSVERGQETTCLTFDLHFDPTDLTACTPLATVNQCAIADAGAD